MTNLLAGQKILITRASAQAKDLEEKLTKSGACAEVFPVIRFTEPTSFAPLDQAIQNHAKFDWIIFASTNAVDAFFKRVKYLKIDPSVFDKLKTGAIGSSTAKALSKIGFTVSYQPDKFVAEEFIEQFPEKKNLTGLNILWPRTNVGRTIIHDQFTANGAHVTMVEAYRTTLPDHLEKISLRLFQLVNEKQIDMITFASSQTVENFATILKTGLIAHAKSLGYIVNPESRALDSSIKSFFTGSIAIASIGPVTTKTIARRLGKADVEAQIHTIDGLVLAIEEHFCSI